MELSKTKRVIPITKKLEDLENELEELTGENNKPKNKIWDYPTKWKRPIKQSIKSNGILVWFLNIKGELEKPKVYPLRTGGRVIIKGRPYDANPQSFISLEGKQKCLFIREIDRRPVCNLDWAKVKERGDLTDSDDILLKTAMDARIMPKPPLGKSAMAIVGVIAVGVLIYFFTAA